MPKPILFRGPMVRAILDGRKKQTRRVVKFPKGYTPLRYLGEYPAEEDGIDRHWWEFNLSSEAGLLAPYQPGDILWVRETWRHGGICPEYRADHISTRDTIAAPPWRPSIFMPKSACRIFLLVTDVRCQPVREISEEDAMSEGATPILVPPDGGDRPHVEGFRALWDSINAKRGFGWDENPWVWAYSFQRTEKPEGWAG